jgi:RNA polymerase sigma factor (sigma-70 family)
MTPDQVREIVATHKPFVHKHAGRWARNSPQEYDDCVQETYLALLEACRKWSPTGGSNIRTYAIQFVEWRKHRDWISRKRLKRAHVSISLETPVAAPDGGEEITLGDMLGTPATQEDGIDENRRRKIVLRAISELPERERTVVRRRFFNDETLQEIGEDRGVTRERIRQIEAAAFDMLRKKLRAFGVRS